ncbi:DUF5812 family protein [Halocatena pleomorpha]|uniref:Uncharacterized protein n=1 Tax=Halocatena pleomorpha TaxID=1785090 RepID=A0A3P3RGF5_9EURY|nr:DUF5812 family protein [Halocatena pleomorpha]RRJ32008.1 hypothetical protein EIK79_05620 [Halocatena pleomorpha]
MTTETESTFLITHAETDTAVLTDVESGQVHTLSDNPGVEEDDVVEGTIAPEPPMNVTWQIIDIEERRTIPIERGEESPTAKEQELAADQPVGEITRRERAGVGEIHVLTVEPDDTEDVVADVMDDNATRTRAARLGVNRVELRSDPDTGVVSVRYLP